LNCTFPAPVLDVNLALNVIVSFHFADPTGIRIAVVGCPFGRLKFPIRVVAFGALFQLTGSIAFPSVS
jgi:hypothetical protein